MVWKLALKNVRKSVSDYIVYFVTLVAGVAIFYVFNSILEQNIIVRMFEGKMEELASLYQMMTVFSAIVTVILSFLVMYAGSFLMKRRKKEFGIYLLCGMEKGRIVGLLIVETALVGIVSLIVGLVVGMLLSQGMSVVVIHMFEADLSEFAFYISGTAIQKTMLYFCLIYVCALLCDLLVVNQVRLLDLLISGKRLRTYFSDNKAVCMGVFWVAVLLLIAMATRLNTGLERLERVEEIPVMDLLEPVVCGVVMIIICTVAVFWSLSGVILCGLKSRQSYLLRGIHVFTIRELCHRLRSNVISSSAICILLFATICTFSTSFSINRAMNRDLRELVPADVQINYRIAAWDSENPVGEDEVEPMQDVLKEAGMEPNILKESVEISNYFVNEASHNLNWKSGEPACFVKISDYNNLAKLYGKETHELKSDEFMIITVNPEEREYFDGVYLKNDEKITLGGKEYHAKYPTCQEGIIEMSEERGWPATYVLPDDVEDKDIYILGKLLVANYAPEYREAAEEYFAGGELEAVFSKRSEEDETFSASIETKQVIRDRSLGATVMTVFVGMYLGLVLLITGAMVLSLKELSQVMEAKERYHILRQIGTDEKMIGRSHQIQSLVFFLVPLALAVVHAGIVIRVCIWVATEGGNREAEVSIAATAVILLFVYALYYIMTYWFSRKIMKERVD